MQNALFIQDVLHLPDSLGPRALLAVGKALFDLFRCIFSCCLVAQREKFVRIMRDIHHVPEILDLKRLTGRNDRLAGREILIELERRNVLGERTGTEYVQAVY